MARRSRLKPIPDDAPLPDGFVRHDGGPCPVHSYSRPAILFRCGAGHQMGKRDAMRFRWEYRDRPEPMDIVGYQDEPDDFVRIERMDLGAPVSGR